MRSRLAPDEDARVRTGGITARVGRADAGELAQSRCARGGSLRSAAHLELLRSEAAQPHGDPQYTTVPPDPR